MQRDALKREQDVPTPAIVIDGATAHHNLKRMADYAKSHDIKLRPHTKTHKLVSVGRMQIELGAVGLTIAKVGEAGGQTIVEPMDVMGMGVMAVFSDPTGAVCGIWQPGTFAGAELVNEYGAWGWNELGTRDVAAAREFYGAVFGWEVEEQDMGEMGTYYIWKNGEDIDSVLATGFQSVSSEMLSGDKMTLPGHPDAKQVSDHYAEADTLKFD